MPFFNSYLSLPTLEPAQPQKLSKLAETIAPATLHSSKLSDRLDLDKVNPPRLIEEIIQDLEDDRYGKINLLEWVYLLTKKDSWDQNNPKKRSISTAEKIWQHCQENQALQQRLLQHLIDFHFNPQTNKFPQSLVETFADFQAESASDTPQWQIISLLLTNNYTDIASICFQEYLQPNDLFQKHSLPTKVSLTEEISLEQQIQNYFPIALNQIKNPQPEQINFLIDTLDNLSGQNQIIAVENLLNHVSPQLAGNYPNLVNWVKDNYILTTNKSVVKQLSKQSKKIFKKWLGAVNYQELVRFIDLIIDRVSIDSIEDKDLMLRKVFWSNYSDRLQDLKILLPFSTIQAFGNDFQHQDTAQLINDGSQSTEVCILDLEDYLIVEFFRGKGSEVRIFTKVKEVEDILFNSVDISLKQIRFLSTENDSIQDHCEGWQFNLEQVLRSKNIFPNEELKTFQLEVNKTGINYNWQQGLPILNQQQISLRNRQLYDWQADIQELEYDAQRYCQRQERNVSSDRVLVFKDNKSLSNQPKKKRSHKPSNLDFID